jgi:hypothetical protein
LEIKVHPNAVALFNIALATEVGNESEALFGSEFLRNRLLKFGGPLNGIVFSDFRN